MNELRCNKRKLVRLLTIGTLPFGINCEDWSLQWAEAKILMHFTVHATERWYLLSHDSLFYIISYSDYLVMQHSPVKKGSGICVQLQACTHSKRLHHLICRRGWLWARVRSAVARPGRSCQGPYVRWCQALPGGCCSVLFKDLCVCNTKSAQETKH